VHGGFGPGATGKGPHSGNLASGLPVLFHGRVPGRDFRLALRLDPSGALRIEVTDARGDRFPRNPDPAAADAESGHGLLLVTAYADRWGVDEAPAGCKTVWAELSGPGRVAQ
jgi:hypothetical protein